MKKIIIGLIVLLALIIPNIEVKALSDSFYEGNYIQGEYIKKFKDGSGKYEQLRFFRRKSDNQIVYCIELWKTLSSNKSTTGYDIEQYNYANLNYDVWEKIMLIAYYGYGYENHTDNKWYAITQFMIWKETSPGTNIYFTDTLNGNKIEKYQSEMNEINLLIEAHYKLPTFHNKTYIVGSKVKTNILDKNNLLDKFEIINDDNNQVTKNENNLIAVKTSVGKSKIILENSGKRFKVNPIVYIDDVGQNVFAPGNYDPIYAQFNLVLNPGKIIINKLDQDTNTSIPQGDAKIEGTRIQLLDRDMMYVDEKSVKIDGTVTFDNIGYGTYYIKEVKAGVGYLTNPTTIKLELNTESKTLDIYNQVIKNEVVINKYLRNFINEKIVPEIDAVFSIYNSRNQKVETITTDINGIANFSLPYGNYTLRQEKGTKNYRYIGDFEINISKNGIKQTFNLYNDQITSNIKVINVDDDSKLPILEAGAKFKILDLETNEYLKDKDGKELVLETNYLGETDEIIIPSGKYQLDQIKVINGYCFNKSKVYFEINEEVSNLEIKISNIKQTGKLEIDKYTSYYLNDNLVETKKELNIIVPIYAKEDIYSKDGIKLYEKDTTVENAVLEGNKVMTPNLVLGNYYLKKDMDNSIIDIKLDKEEIKKVELINNVYEYQSTDLKESEIGENIIEVPNTLKEKNILSNINLLCIILGLYMIRKGNKYEKN